ncbi:myocyte-specific enhancer factor 2A-like [Hemiscyllium ocellatum]|uniref:myocyte-specific enhancer factor 2A-like n=1 Tax=Hemiscyllium ocellatum TaxID=170820 RepID=UPI0029668EC9|nr:myocyte-specific enhancer factor 2A-like [Hemiscyllium ocellatum]
MSPGSQLPQLSTLTVSSCEEVHVKLEPVSPTREHRSPSGLLRQAVGTETGRSPVDSLTSNSSSFEGTDREDVRDYLTPVGTLAVPLGEPTDDPTVKRMRMDAWVT